MLKLKISYLLLIFTTSSLFISKQSFSQDKTKLSSFRDLSRPEKWWVIRHLFIAKKTFEISTESLETAKQIEKTNILDGDIHGGQVDAFKHAYWMAMLVKEISARKARQLGIVHEKGDFLQFKKDRRKNKTNTHDAIASEMDLFNNDVGIEIGLENKNSTAKELKNKIIDAVLEGRMRIILKNEHGRYLDKNGNVISESNYSNHWENSKVLVPSDQVNVNN